MPAFGVVDGVQNATVEMAHTAPYYFFGKDPTFALGCAIPFGLNSRQMTAWMYEGNGLKLMREFYAKYNIINFPGGNTGAQMGGWFRKEIKSLADMKGLKFRIGGFGGKVIERIGGVPQNIPGGEIYQALEKGTIDAAEWVGPYDDQKLGFYKVAPYYAYPGWWEGGPQLDFFINTKAYEGLSSEYKAIVEAAATYAHVDMQAKYDARNPAALKTLVGSGAKLFRFPRDIDGRRVQGGDGPLQRARAAATRRGRRSTRTTRRSVATRTSGSASPRPASTTSCSRRSSDARDRRRRRPCPSPASLRRAGLFPGRPAGEARSRRRTCRERSALLRGLSRVAARSRRAPASAVAGAEPGVADAAGARRRRARTTGSRPWRDLPCASPGTPCRRSISDRLVAAARDQRREGDDKPTMRTWISTNGTAPQ